MRFSVSQIASLKIVSRFTVLQSKFQRVEKITVVSVQKIQLTQEPQAAAAHLQILSPFREKPV
jgi:hypothetical protein